MMQSIEHAAGSIKRVVAFRSVTVTPAAAELTIPVGETNAETTYRAAVTNQYGETVKDPTVEWSLSEKATGVSIDNAGKVTVTAGAKDPITSSKQFTVTAKYGAAEGAACRKPRHPRRWHEHDGHAEHQRCQGSVRRGRGPEREC